MVNPNAHTPTAAALMHTLTAGSTPLLAAAPHHLDLAHSTAAGYHHAQPGTWAFDPASLAIDAGHC